MKSRIYNNTNNITNVPELRATSDYWDAVSLSFFLSFFLESNLNYYDEKSEYLHRY